MDQAEVAQLLAELHDNIGDASGLELESTVQGLCRY
jgi:hypothetical protein